MDGLILVDKPAGVSSHDVVAAVRRRLGGRRSGHAGTLDPFATGLLLVLVGRATRVQRFLTALPKTYAAVARFGVISSTGDCDGELTSTGVLPTGPLQLPTGELRQRPPAHSAVHVDGERAYRRARRGESFQVPERVVCVHRFEQLWREGDRAAFEIACSAGTYVRSLIGALGDAYCEQLRRTQIGPFHVDDAQPLDVTACVEDSRPWGLGVPPPTAARGSRARIQVDAPASLRVLPLERALAFMPVMRVGEADARRVRHGQAVALPAGLAQVQPGAERSAPGLLEAAPGEADPVLLTSEHGALAIAHLRGGGADRRLQPAVVLAG